jgi:hypothetical protein
LEDRRISAKSIAEQLDITRDVVLIPKNRGKNISIGFLPSEFFGGGAG